MFLLTFFFAIGVTALLFLIHFLNRKNIVTNMKEIKYLYMHDMSQILRNIFPSSQFFKKKKKN